MKILVIDDEKVLADLIAQRLHKAGHEVQTAYRGEEALQAAAKFKPEAVLSDHYLPDYSGIELLAPLKALLPGAPIIMMTAAGSSKLAVQAMKAGAEDYLDKPINFDELQILLERIDERRQLRDELESIKQTRREEAVGELNMLAGASMQAIYEEIERVAAMDRVTVLIGGETGTGKEHVAKLLHRLSQRASKPFVEFNCAAFPENLAESELFGYEAGAFTDAKKSKKGLLESAQGGTVFFDEVGELSLVMQAKLLKVLEDKQARRLGGLDTISLDIRIVAASNRDLGKEAEAGRFRQDLYYRLSVFPLTLPPLRERKADIPRLARFFFDKAQAEFGRKLEPLSKPLLQLLEKQRWNGNVRELKNVVEGLVIRSRGAAVQLQDLQALLGSDAPPARDGAAAQSAPAEEALPDPAQEGFPGLKEVLDQSSRSIKKRMIQAALERSAGNKSEAARLLQVDYKTLYNLVKELDISAKVSYADKDA